MNYRYYYTFHRSKKDTAPMNTSLVIHDLDIRLFAFDRVTCGREWNYRNVNSPFARLLYTLNGKAYVRHGGQRYTLSRGTLILVPPFVPVDYLCPGHFESYYAIFTCRSHSGVDIFRLGLLEYSTSEDAMTLPLFQRVHHANPDMGLKRVDPGDPSYNTLIWQADPDRHLSPANLMITDGCLRIILAMFANGVPATTEPRFLPVIRYINTHLQDSLSLEKMAATAGLHPTYFSDAFAIETGQRPIAYLTEKRLEHAQLLLQSTRQTIKEIAGACGFENPDYFCRVFKAKLGLSPSEYRQSETGTKV